MWRETVDQGGGGGGWIGGGVCGEDGIGGQSVTCSLQGPIGSGWWSGPPAGVLPADLLLGL